MHLQFLIAILAICLQSTSAIVLDVNNDRKWYYCPPHAPTCANIHKESIRDAALLVAHGVQELYNGNVSGGTLGKWPYPPYYWWESGGAWGGMMQYRHFTGDGSYDSVMYAALMSQLGPNYDFVLPQEAFDTGNDDQAFWVFVAMSAAEYGFPQPQSPAPSWVRIVMNAWEDYVQRWNADAALACNGGLKWQFYPSNAGYNYRNSISNGAFFQLSARLARYTGNQTYVDWANRIWDWSRGIGLIDNIYNVFDGSDDTINCTKLDHHQWTYNVGVYLYGAAVLSNYTNASSAWVERTAGLLAAIDTFVSPSANATDVIFEATCEPDVSCNVDQQSMKAYLARWLANTSLMAPFTAGRVAEVLRASASGAAAACTGGAYGNTCGSKWYVGGFDGLTGLGQELSALDVITALLVNGSAPPITQPNVFIGRQPTNVVTTLPPSITSVAPTSTGRPLYDQHGEAGSQKNTSIWAMILLIVAGLLIV